MVAIPNYYERAIALLASQFQIKMPDGSRTNFQKMLYAIITQFQEIQTQLNLLNTMRSLDTAQGVQLYGTVQKDGVDVIVGLGTIIGLARLPGQSDESYRQALKFQIFVNQSSGTPEQVIEMLKFLTQANTIYYDEFYPAGYIMTTDGLEFPENPSDLVDAIQASSPAGVEFLGVTAIYDSVPFVFSNDPFNEQLFVAPNVADPFELHPLQVDGGSGPADFYINRGQTTDPDFGGGFSEAIWVNEPTTPEIYTYDEVGAGQLAEFIEGN